MTIKTTVKHAFKMWFWHKNTWLENKIEEVQVDYIWFLPLLLLLSLLKFELLLVSLFNLSLCCLCCCCCVQLIHACVGALFDTHYIYQQHRHCYIELHIHITNSKTIYFYKYDYLARNTGINYKKNERGWGK